MCAKRALPDKAALRAALRDQLAAALATAEAAHAAAIEGATHSEARAENDKDTRGLEQSYLARGQAVRVAELRAAVAATEALALRAFAVGDPIAVTALVTIRDADADGDERWLLAPAGGGTTLPGGVVVVTPSSPLGRALIGRRVGDELEVKVAARSRQLEIIAVD